MSNTLVSEYPDEADDDIIYEVKEGDQGIVHFDPVVPGVMQSNPVMAKMALMLSSQGWNILGHGNDPNIAASNDMTITVERITSLFLIRIVALVSHRNSLLPCPAAYIPKFSDLSATTICKEALERKKPWPKPITMHIIQQLRGFIRNILEKYNAVHYHSFEHAYHVTISVHKLTELMLSNSHSELDIKIAEEVRRMHLSSNKSTSERRLNVNPTKLLPRKTFGLKSDPLMTLSLLFSALVHDVEHRGVPNRQLVLESHELAILYNDQSVAEQRSLAVAFSELMKPDFKELRDVIFEGTDEYHRFRKAVINTVLATDVASPERTQLVKSKWKEAFGDPSETVERKKNKELSRRNIFSIVREKPGSNRTSTSLPVNWKGRQDSKPRQIYGANNARQRRRGSQGTSAASSKSMMSDLTIDPSLRFLARGNCETSKEALSYIHDNESDEESKSATPESSDGQESFDEMESRQIDNKTFLTNTDPSIAKSLARKPSIEPKSKKQDSL
jgi:3'5'-cyclic nucleotide phosphodiesterase